MNPEEKAAADKAAQEKAAADKAAQEKAAADKAAAEKVLISKEDAELLAELKASENNKEEKKVSLKKKNQDAIDAEDYQRFATLKFLMWNGKSYERKKLKPATLEAYDLLEKKFKAYKGKKPTKSATAHLGTGIGVGKVVEGYAVPESLYKKFVKKGIVKRYFS